jgi:hypothetical protein
MNFMGWFYQQRFYFCIPLTLALSHKGRGNKDRPCQKIELSACHGELFQASVFIFVGSSL